MILKICLFFGAVVLLKIILNLYYLLISKYYKKQYEQYIKGENGNYISTHKQMIKRLFIKAGIKDISLPHSEAAGFGQVANMNLSVFDNMYLKSPRITSFIYNFLNETIVIYSSRIKNSLNPIYWIESIVFLPTTLLGYLGVDSKNVGVKIINVLWWVFSIILVVFKEYLVEKLTL